MDKPCIKHPDRKAAVRGMCASCYQVWWVRSKKYPDCTVKATCHPSRPHAANGLCNNCYQNKWKKEHPHNGVEYRHGLRPGALVEMFGRQHGRCAICRAPGTIQKSTRSGKERLGLDHNHTTGRVRALLCDRCNRGLGFFREDPMILRRAASYVVKHNGLAGERP